MKFETEPRERPELGLPTFDDFRVIKDALLGLAEAPDSVVRSTDQGNGVSILLTERLHADLDSILWPLAMFSISTKMRYYQGGNKVVVRYRELSCHQDTVNSGLTHDYMFATLDGELTEFGQSIRAAPPMPEPMKDESLSDKEMDQADRGAKILRSNLGNNLEPTAGDCGVLYDRIMFFLD